jgi:hypothetical protein
VAENTDAGRTYRFTHDLVRDEVLGRTTSAFARALHQAAAQAQEQARDITEAARIAAHWRRAGKEPGHRAAAAHSSRIAADQARDAGCALDALDALRSRCMRPRTSSCAGRAPWMGEQWRTLTGWGGFG